MSRALPYGVVVAGGSVRAASTLQYNILERIAQLHSGLACVGMVDNPGQFVALYEQSIGKATTIAIMCHVPVIYRDEKIGELYRRGLATAVYTYRDPRDVVVSLMDVWGGTFHKTVSSMKVLVEKYGTEWNKTDGKYVARYEDWYLNIATQAYLIAEHIGIHLTVNEALLIEADLSLAKQRERQGENLLDKHISDGAVGKWRSRLTRTQECAVLAATSAVTEEWGYESERYIDAAIQEEVERNERRSD